MRCRNPNPRVLELCVAPRLQDALSLGRALLNEVKSAQQDSPYAQSLKVFTVYCFSMLSLKHILLLPAVLRPLCVAYTPLSDHSLEHLPSPNSDDFDIKTGAILAPILQVRVPGTEGSRRVQQHFIQWFQSNLPEWKLEYQNSTQTTPVSNGKGVPFVNIVATRDPPWVKKDGEVGRLALVAHYDSKLTPTGFIGAIDSAAPCAMVLHAARSINTALTRKWETMQASGASSDDLESHKGIQIMLLDGEEAFDVWSETDSLYGARALAEEWEETSYAVGSTFNTPLGSIDLFVLLDLLGSPDPKVPSYFKTTHWAYQNMADAESRLRKLGRFESASDSAHKRSPSAHSERSPPAFLTEANKPESAQWHGGLIGDDHEPFLARGVEVLHLIPNPFPRVWHRIDDDGAHLDMPTVYDWAVLTAAFVAEWMDLEGHFEATASQEASNKRNSVVKDEL